MSAHYVVLQPNVQRPFEFRHTCLLAPPDSCLRLNPAVTAHAPFFGFKAPVLPTERIERFAFWPAGIRRPILPIQDIVRNGTGTGNGFLPR